MSVYDVDVLLLNTYMELSWVDVKVKVTACATAY